MFHHDAERVFIIPGLVEGVKVGAPQRWRTKCIKSIS